MLVPSGRNACLGNMREFMSGTPVAFDPVIQHLLEEASSQCMSGGNQKYNMFFAICLSAMLLKCVCGWPQGFEA
eukprot:6421551-Amphidinium_carterae.1